MSTRKGTVLRLSIPEDDTETRRWLDAQDNMSLSVRLIIHDVIQSQGYTDRVFGEMSPRVHAGTDTGRTEIPSHHPPTHTDSSPSDHPITGMDIMNAAFSGNGKSKDKVPGIDEDGFVDDPMVFLKH